jgi:hypothetical protein
MSLVNEMDVVTDFSNMDINENKREKDKEEIQCKFYIDNDLDTNHQCFVAKIHLNFYQIWSMFMQLPCVYKSGKCKYEWKLKHTTSDVVMSIYDWNNKNRLLDTKVWYIGCSINDKKVIGEFLGVLCEAIECYNFYYKNPIETKTFKSDIEKVNDALFDIKKSLIENKHILNKL